MERSFHDCLSVLKRVLESGTVSPGGGCVEAALSVALENWANTQGDTEQVAYQAFADALLVIPRTLATNAALDATELLAQLRASHYAAQKGEKGALKSSGLDLFEGAIVDNIEAGVLEPTMSKIKSIRFATEAAIGILRIDDVFKLDPKHRPKGPQGGMGGMM